MAAQLQDNMLQAFSLCTSILGVQGLASLAACSRQLKDASTAMLCSNALQLLKGALKPVRAVQDNPVTSIDSAADLVACQRKKAQCMHAVVWLLRAAPSAAVAAAAVSESLIHIPAVPIVFAVQLVAAGVRVSYAQLLAAANSMVAGVEVWVQAQQLLGVNTDIPEVAVAVCCATDERDSCFIVGHLNYVGVLQLPIGISVDLLQLAMNCSRAATAEAAVQHVSAQLTADIVYKLMATAAVRQHHSALELMAQSAAVRQRLDARALEALIKALSPHNSWCIRFLLEMPAAAALSADAVEQLMHAAVQQYDSSCLEQLGMLPTGRHLSSKAVIRLLLAALQDCGCTEPTILQLCRIPAVSSIDANDLLQLIPSLTRDNLWVLAELLSHVPGGQRMGSEVVRRMLLAALQEPRDEYASVYQLCCTPAATFLRPEAVVQLLMAAVDVDNADGVAMLSQLWAAKRLNTSETAELLTVAVQQGRVACLAQLCSCPAAEKLSTLEVVQLLQAALEKGSIECIEQLAKLPAAEQLRKADLDVLDDTMSRHHASHCLAALDAIWLRWLDVRYADRSGNSSSSHRDRRNQAPAFFFTLLCGWYGVCGRQPMYTAVRTAVLELQQPCWSKLKWSLNCELK